MKKIYFIILMSFIVIVMASCNRSSVTTMLSTQSSNTSTGSTNSSGTGAHYKDGTYTAEGDHRTYGYESATVTVVNGAISNIVLKRLNADGTEVDYTQWTGTPDSNGQTKPNLNKYRFDMANAMLAKQSANVDVITGATDSSNGWITAVTRALAKAV